ncbi:MAG: hypothetical protein ABIO16_16640 [Nocardioides sp.]
MRRSGPVLVAVLLVSSAALTWTSAWLRWQSVCPIGGDWNSDACLVRQEHAFDSVPVSEPWQADPSWSLWGGLGMTLLAMAVLLLPLALSTHRWQRAALVLPALSLGIVGVTATLSGLQERVVDVPAHPLAIYLILLPLPVALLLMLRRPGPMSTGGQLRGLVVTSLVLATPLAQALLVAPVLILYSSYDTAPWTEAAVVPCLLAAAAGLRPWSATRTVTPADQEQRPVPARSA